MMQSIYTAASGLSAQNERLSAIANNIANVQTNGFKATRVDFKDLLYRQMLSPLEGSDTDLMLGCGAATVQTTHQFTIGSVNETGRALDAMIMTEGFYAAQMPNGDTVYTRDGNFKLSPVGDTDYLVTAQGYFVLDTNGGRIPVTGDLGTIQISDAGVISTSDGQSSALQIVTFSNKAGLESAGGNYFTPTENSGVMSAAAQPEVRQGYLEGANVDLADQFTTLIRTQRAFQMASRALTVADAMMGTTNNIRT